MTPETARKYLIDAWSYARRYVLWGALFGSGVLAAQHCDTLARNAPIVYVPESVEAEFPGITQAFKVAAHEWCQADVCGARVIGGGMPRPGDEHWTVTVVDSVESTTFDDQGS